MYCWRRDLKVALNIRFCREIYLATTRRLFALDDLSTLPG